MKNYREIADEGRAEADEILRKMERKVHAVYRTAYSEIQAKADEYLKDFIKEDSRLREQVKNGTLSPEDYRQWRRSHMMTGHRWFEMADVLASDMVNSNLIAGSIINYHLPEVYAVGYNYGLYTVEKQALFETSFTLYDRHTVENLIRENPDLLPRAKINIPKDLRWNKNKINSAVTQGILQGETIPEIAERLAKVTDMNENSAIRNARTMTTSAENAGRIESYRNTESLGIKVKKTWIATLDGRTRNSHRRLDGETISDIDDTFSNGLRYPADPQGAPEEVYQCRCTTISQVVPVDLSRRTGKLGDMSYEEWKNAKGNEPFFKKAQNEKRDKKQFDNYKKLKLENMPKNFKDFQDLKYDTPDKWEELKKSARQARKKE